MIMTPPERAARSGQVHFVVLDATFTNMGKRKIISDSEEEEDVAVATSEDEAPKPKSKARATKVCLLPIPLEHVKLTRCSPR